MNQDRTKRKLTAIFSADVVGYSRLMEADEAWTIKNLDENKRLIGKFIEEYGGRVIDAIGDNLLAEFNSIINSVECAVKIQQELKKKNDTLVEERRMHFRIGVNLGDVVEEDGRIYGSGVNIASRLEGLAEPGGICISGRTYDHIKTRLGLGYKYLGEHNVKNIDEPIRIYRLLMEPESAGKVIEEKKRIGGMSRRIGISAATAIIVFIAAGLLYWKFYSIDSSRIEERPIETEQAPTVSEVEEGPKTIAVLPFDNLSPDPEQAYFADGIAEELLNSLTRISELEVRGRTSSFSFKDKKEDLRTISEMLNVEYVLEGSVRKAGEQVRITVQLINTRKDAHIWSETYERTMDGIFAIQDDIAQSVADALQITLGIGELGRAPGMTSNITAYDTFLSGRSLRLQSGRENISQAIEQLEQAVALDPNFAIGWNALATAYYRAANTWIPERAEEFLAKRRAAHSRVVELIPESDSALLINASRSGDLMEEERLYKKALAVDPANFETNVEYGMFLNRVGRPTEAINYIQRAVRLEHLASGTYIPLGITYELIENSDAAAMAFKKGRELSNQVPVYNSALMVLAMEEKNRALIDEYVALVLNTGLLGNINRSDTRDINQVMHALLDTPEEAGAELRLFLTDPAYNNPFNRSGISTWASYFGKFELALQVLKESSESDLSTIWTIWRPINKGMRQLPGFKDFVKELGLVDYWRKSGNWGDFCRPVGDDDFECE